MKSRPKKRNSNQRHGKNPPSSPIKKSASPSTPQTASRKWLFRILAAFILPILVLLIIEAGLRLCGYGYDTRFFKAIQLGGKAMMVENDDFGFRFFPPEVARLPRPTMIEAHKPAEVYRIFIFGESAAEGDPDPAFGPARYMEMLLRERFPQQLFEIVNVGVTANNSHGILPIARECAGLEGNLWIIYMGNNEMIGPFGATGVFGRQAPPLPLVRANLALQETRLGQLLKAGASHLKMGRSTNAEWGGLEMFAEHHVNPSDPSKEVVYRNFQGNLRDILLAGKGSGAGIILNTVAVNLKDCPPLASETSATLTASGRTNVEQLCAEAKVLVDAGDVASAVQRLEQAISLDPKYAEAQYRLGECLLAITNFNAANIHFQLACDNDAIPARTDSRINAIIRRAVEQSAEHRLVLCDAAQRLGTNNPTGICGDESFYEHVHFNPNGGYALGRMWAEEAEAFLPDSIKRTATNPWVSQAQCERRLAMTDWNRRNDLNEIVNRRHHEPLSGQSNNDRELAALQAALADLGKRMNAAEADEARQIFSEALQQAPQDLDLHVNYADFLEAVGGIREAREQWRQVQQLRPDYFLGYFQEGRMLERMGDLGAAQTAFQRTVDLRPRMAAAWFELSNIAASQGNFDLALQHVEHASRLQPHLPVYYACMGKLLSRLSRHTEAVERYRQSVQVDPKYYDGHFALGGELAGNRDWPDAETEFEACVRLRPDSVAAHLNLGAALAQQNQNGAAEKELERVLQLDPANQQANTLLNQLREASGGLPASKP